MNKIAMTAIAAALAFSTPVIAEDAHHPEKAAEAKGATAQPAPQVKKMPAQLDRVAKARTDAERQKAMAEHMQTMRENMKMAHDMKAGMMDCPMMEGGMMGKGGMGMMGGGMMGKGGMGMGGGAAPADAPDRMQQMEKRMDMMQMMMEQMMRRQDGPAPAPMPMK